ncbi:MAG: hypothetical protein ACW99U_18885 [Candidatus Thorarchaeota archaeon]|jgi:hypothetical protein
MAWYYVKNGGTATGDGGRVTTQRTGAWSGTTSEYYDTLEDAINATTTPTDGDLILCSDLHSGTNTAGASINLGSGATGGVGLQIISVDDANQENYKPGASETSTERWALNANGLVAGVELLSTNASLPSPYADVDCRVWRFIDAKTSSGIGTFDSLFIDGAKIDLINTDVDVNSSLPLFHVEEGCCVRWMGGKSINGSALIASTSFTAGGGTLIVEGVDLTSLPAIIASAFSSSDSDVFMISLVKCELDSSVTLPADSVLALPQHIFEMRGCDDSTGGDTFRFHYQTGTGKAVNNESTFVTNEKAWGEPSSPEKRSSVAVTTKSNCSHLFPFIFDLPLAQEYIDLADATENVLRLPVLSELTLTDTEIAAFMMYPDGTTAVIPVWITSGKVVSPTGSPEQRNYGVDPLAAGTELPTQSPETDWTIGGGSPIPNKYYLELDTSTIAGQAQAVSVRIEVYRASIAAGELFIATEFEKF